MSKYALIEDIGGPPDDPTYKVTFVETRDDLVKLKKESLAKGHLPWTYKYEDTYEYGEVTHPTQKEI